MSNECKPKNEIWERDDVFSDSNGLCQCYLVVMMSYNSMWWNHSLAYGAEGLLIFPFLHGVIILFEFFAKLVDVLLRGYFSTEKQLMEIYFIRHIQSFYCGNIYYCSGLTKTLSNEHMYWSFFRVPFVPSSSLFSLVYIHPCCP